MTVLKRKVSHLLPLALALAFSFVLSCKASAQTVSKINKAKGQILVTGDGISPTKGGQACINGKNGKVIGCGKIINVKKGKVLVKIDDAAVFPKIKKGLAVTFKAPATASSDDSSKQSTKKNPMVMRVIWAPALLAPVNYKKAAYNPPLTSGSGNVLWKSDEAIKTAFLGFGVNASIPFGSAMGLSPGFRYRIYSGSDLETDYDPAEKLKYASINQSMSAIGLWADFQYMRIPFGSSAALAGLGGIDIEMSTATLKANRHDERNGSEAELAKMTSKLSVVSLRAGALFDMNLFGKGGINFGLNLLIPLVKFGKSFSATTNDEFANRSSDDVADLEAAVSHDKTSFGLELTAGVGYSL